MYNVVTETPAFLPDMSYSFMKNVDTSYIWITPYKTRKEAEEAAAFIRKNGNHNATTVVEEVDTMQELANQAQELEIL